MSRIFLSYAKGRRLQALALRDWLNAKGWEDVALEFDPAHGAQPNDRARSVRQSISGCEAVVFLVAHDWLASKESCDAYDIARKLNKAVFFALIENVPMDPPPLHLLQSDRLVSLFSDENAAASGGPEAAEPSFSAEGLEKLATGLARAAVDPRFFDWPPPDEPGRAPYRGLDGFEAVDAGIFFGRDAPMIEALDRLRGLAEAPGSRILVVLGAPGVGKSSFLRAGLGPRLDRDKCDFLPLPVIRPGRAAVNGAEGFAAALLRAAQTAKVETSASKIREALAGGPDDLRPLLQDVTARAAVGLKPPTLVVVVDQAEELFCAEGADESQILLKLLEGLVTQDDPEVLLIFAVRSESFDALARTKPLQGRTPCILALAPPPQEGLRAAIEGPSRRVTQAGGALEIDPDLVQALLTDLEDCKDDALPLLAFTLEQLYRACGAHKRMALADYESSGRLAGAIDSALERVFAAADGDPRLPKEKESRLSLLRAALVPAFAGVDPATRKLRRRIVADEQLPQDARPLIELLVAQHVLTQKSDAVSGETTFELAHEALLRRWGALRHWLEEDLERYARLDGVKRASRKWEALSRSSAFIAHNGVLLEEAQRLYAWPNFAAQLESVDRAYLSACFEETKRVREEGEARSREQVERAQQERDKHMRRARNAQVGALASSLALSGALALAALAGWQWLDAAQENKRAWAQREHLEKTTAQLSGAANSLALALAERLKDLSFAPAATKAALLDKTRDLQRQTIAGGVAAGDDLRRSESVVLNELAQARLAMGDVKGAVDAAEESTALMKALSSANFDNANWRRDLSVSYERLGDAQQAMGDLSGALKSYREDLAIAQALAAADAANLQWLWDLSTSNQKIGDVRRAQKDLDGALQSYREALAIRAGVAYANAGNVGWRRDLAVSYERLGAALAEQGDAKGAVAAFQQASAIYQALVRADPHDALSLAYSVVPHWRLAELDGARQRDHLESALESLHLLAAQDRLDAKRQAWLVQIEARLKALDQDTPAGQPATTR